MHTDSGTSTKYRKNFPDLKYKGVKRQQKTSRIQRIFDATIKNALKVALPDAIFFTGAMKITFGFCNNCIRKIKYITDRVCLWIKNNFNVTPQKAFNKVFESMCLWHNRASLFKSIISKISMKL